MTQSIRNASQWSQLRAKDINIQEGGVVTVSGPGALLAKTIIDDVNATISGGADTPATTAVKDGIRGAVSYDHANRYYTVDLSPSSTFPTWAMYVAAVGMSSSGAAPTSFFAPPAAPVPAPVDPLAVVAADPTAPAWLPDVLRAMMPQDQDGRPGPAAPLFMVADLTKGVETLESRVSTLEAGRRSRGDGFWARLTQPRVRG